MKIVRATDIHLNFLHEAKVKAFIRHIKEIDPELVLIGGDISNGDPTKYLNQISENIWQDIYFILGNHDFYGESIDNLRKTVVDKEKIRYLTNRGTIHLDDHTSIVGHDGWGDGRNGFVDSAFIDPREANSVQLNDFHEIMDLKMVYSPFTRPLFIAKLKELGQQTADHFQKHLEYTHQNIIVLTHVPPFNQACFYRRSNNGPILPQDGFWSPFFSCKAAGDILIKYAEDNPDKKILVLAGHTHEPADVKIRDNLRCIVGSGSYNKPKLDVIDTEEIFKSL